jgi:hypothetical protein
MKRRTKIELALLQLAAIAGKRMEVVQSVTTRNYTVHIPSLEIKIGGILRSASYSTGKTKRDALQSMFEELTSIPEGQKLVFDAYSNKPRVYYRWDSNLAVWTQVD